MVADFQEGTVAWEVVEQAMPVEADWAKRY
jgi:hypothetical protein